MATSPANPAEIQDRTKKDHGKPVQAGDRTQSEAGGEGGKQADAAGRQAGGTGNK